MKKTFLIPLLGAALTASSLAGMASAQTAPAPVSAPTTAAPAPTAAPTPASGLPASWNNAALSKASYVILDPVVQGNTNVVNPTQLSQIVAALKHDAGGAIKRRYPDAQVVTDPNTPGVIKITPGIVAPGSLTPWAKMNFSMTLDLPDGRVQLVDSFSVLTLWQQSWNATNYAADQLFRKMP